MSDTLTSPSGKTLVRRASRTTTPKESSEAKIIRIAQEKKVRLAENEALLADQNVSAFLKAIAEAEGGGYDFKYGAVKGKKNDVWRFADFSTHPGPGFGGKTTAAGMYQINIATWREHGGKMDLSDCSPKTQDLIVIELLRSVGIIDKIKAGDIAGAMGAASRKWAALPAGPGLSGLTRTSHQSNTILFLKPIRLTEAEENELTLASSLGRCEHGYWIDVAIILRSRKWQQQSNAEPARSGIESWRLFHQSAKKHCCVRMEACSYASERRISIWRN